MTINMAIALMKITLQGNSLNPNSWQYKKQMKKKKKVTLKQMKAISGAQLIN